MLAEAASHFKTWATSSTFYPERVNGSHSMIILAFELEDSSERIVQYLAEQCGVL